MSELNSYKPYARIVSIISGLIIIIASLDASQVIQLFPEYASQINSILVLAGIIAPILAQEKRVVRAEELIHEEYATSEDEPENVVVNLTLDGEDVIKEDTEDSIIEDEEYLDDDEGC